MTKTWLHQLFRNNPISVLFVSDKFKKTVVFVIMFLMTIHLSYAQKLLHTFQFNGGLISNETADIYVGKIDYLPQLKWDNDVFRVGLGVSTLYTRKELEAAGGLNFSWRVVSFSALNSNLPLGGLYVRPAFELTTFSEKILSGTLSLELAQLAINFSYGRDLEFKNNWFSTGFAFYFSKAENDDDE
jgi:hypothetical protein